MSNFWQEIFKLHGVELGHSSSYHPQTYGQIELVNRCLVTCLRCRTCNLPKSWNKLISLAEFWYNTTYYTTIKVNPFQALYGIPLPVH